jgi:hypothetical protein
MVGSWNVWITASRLGQWVSTTGDSGAATVNKGRWLNINWKQRERAYRVADYTE